MLGIWPRGDWRACVGLDLLYSTPRDRICPIGVGLDVRVGPAQPSPACPDPSWSMLLRRELSSAWRTNAGRRHVSGVPVEAGLGGRDYRPPYRVGIFFVFQIIKFLCLTFLFLSCQKHQIYAIKVYREKYKPSQTL